MGSLLKVEIAIWNCDESSVGGGGWDENLGGEQGTAENQRGLHTDWLSGLSYLLLLARWHERATERHSVLSAIPARLGFQPAKLVLEMAARPSAKLLLGFLPLPSNSSGSFYFCLA